MTVKVDLVGTNDIMGAILGSYSYGALAASYDPANFEGHTTMRSLHSTCTGPGLHLQCPGAVTPRVTTILCAFPTRATQETQLATTYL